MNTICGTLLGLLLRGWGNMKPDSGWGMKESGKLPESTPHLERIVGGTSPRHNGIESSLRFTVWVALWLMEVKFPLWEEWSLEAGTFLMWNYEVQPEATEMNVFLWGGCLLVTQGRINQPDDQGPVLQSLQHECPLHTRNQRWKDKQNRHNPCFLRACHTADPRDSLST